MADRWRVPVEARTEQILPEPLQGRVESHELPSRCLEGNPWGDPTVRTLPVYVPPSGETDGRPLLVLLSGYTGAGWRHFQRSTYFQESLLHVLDRLIRTGRVPEAVLVAPDCLTTLGGSQYLNSSATGAYDDYVTREVVPWVQETYRTGAVAVVGSSSGGYGALSLGLRHPELFPVVASNVGDAYFEYAYLPEFPTAFREIRRAGGPGPLLRKLFTESINGFGPGHPIAKALSVMAMASCYSPVEAEPGRFDLPFDLETGELRTDVWARWQALDPVRMVEREPFRSAARRLRYVYVDGALRDEWGLDVGARIFTQKARAAGARIDHEEFDAAHFDRVPRYEILYARVLKALTAEAPK